MVVQRGDLACCIRCAGPTAVDRLARRAVLRAAVHLPPAAPPPAAPALSPPAGPAAVPRFPVLTGTVLDTSLHVVTFVGSDGEQRVALPPDTSVWRGRPGDATALEAGDSVVIRLLPGLRGVADRIWANAGRVTGLIVASDRDGLLVDEGQTSRRQVVVIPPRAGFRSASRDWNPATCSTSSGCAAPGTWRPGSRRHPSRPTGRMRHQPRRGPGPRSRTASPARPSGTSPAPMRTPPGSAIRRSTRRPRAWSTRCPGPRARTCRSCRWAACCGSATSAPAPPACGRCPAARPARRCSATGA